MPGDRRAAEARLEALEERLGQRDFGQQDERLPALAEAFGDRLEIDFGLARSGDAVEQDRVEALADRRGQARGGVALLVVELGRGEVGVGAVERAVGVDRDRFERAGVDQAAEHRVADFGMVGELADRALAAVEPLERLLALRGQPLGDEAGRPIFGQLARRLRARPTRAGSSAAPRRAG